jgi:N-acetylglucosaminyldiphosphoundecaprenol N-acetyl-beta-D-mannosaminyltransferase
VHAADPNRKAGGHSSGAYGPPNGRRQLQKVDICGTPLALTDYERALDWMDASVAAGQKGYVCVAAVHTVMLAREDKELRSAVLGADMVVPDGQPLVWAMNALGHDLDARVYGPDLMRKAFERAAKTGTSMFIYGCNDRAMLDAFLDKLKADYPAIKIAGSYSPLFRPLSIAEQQDVARAINDAAPDIVWCGLGVPRQEKWMATMRDRLDAPVLVGVGAAFDFLGGRVSEAPLWVQKRGLEWAYRLTREPKRLFWRYAKYNPLFVLTFTIQYLRARLRGR